MASEGAADIGRLAWVIASVALFLAASLTFGHRFVLIAIRLVHDSFGSEFPVVTLILVIMCGLTLTTEALGVQAVLGAFVAGVLIGESPILTKHISDQLRGMVASFFAPVFFALAGLNSGLTIPRVAAHGAARRGPHSRRQRRQIRERPHRRRDRAAVESGGAGAGDRNECQGLDRAEFVASIGLSIGALSRDLYSMIVAMAVVTTCTMPPTLCPGLARAPMRPGEREWLEREVFEAKGLVANMERFLIAASDHPNEEFGSRLAGLIAGPRGRSVTMLGVPPASGEAGEPTGAEMASAVKRGADVAREADPEEAARTPPAPVKTRTEPRRDCAIAVGRALKGYDFLFVGLDPAPMPDGGFNPDILASARSFGGPLAVAIVRGAHKHDPVGGPLRLLVPIHWRPDFSARRRGRERIRTRESRRTHLPLARGTTAFMPLGAPAANLNASQQGCSDQISRRGRRSSRSIGAGNQPAVGRLAGCHSRTGRRRESVTDHSRRRYAAERDFAFLARRPIVSWRRTRALSYSLRAEKEGGLSRPVLLSVSDQLRLAFH